MNGCLLLVEDDDAIAEVVQWHLAQAGFELQREADGGRALQTIASRRWDLVLLDLTLPGADGWDICRHLREHHAQVPVMILSARSDEAQRVLGLELGADDYLAKPFSMLEMVARVRALLRRAALVRRAPPAELRVGRFRLDPVRRALCSAGRVVPLSLREFDLLHFLALHPGQVFSRADLLDRVWGAGFDGYEHTVNSHINRLRMKLEADPHEPAGPPQGRIPECAARRHPDEPAGPPQGRMPEGAARRLPDEPALIQTVWGVGYRFEPAAA